MDIKIIRMYEQNENSERPFLRKYRKVIWSIICILSCSSIVLLIAGLSIRTVNGKNDQLSQNFLIVFGSIVGFMVIMGLLYCICAICNDDI